MPVLAARISAKMSWLDHEVAFVQSLFLNSFMVARYAGPVWLIQTVGAPSSTYTAD